jgi:uncharacterized membrane protein HdeD (DUF308 family)
MKDFKVLVDAIENIQTLESKEQKEARLKELKKQILTLEISVIGIGLIILSLIVLPFFSIISFNVTSVLAILGGIALIVKAFKDGDTLETEKYFLLISISNDKNQDKDGK